MASSSFKVLPSLGNLSGKPDLADFERRKRARYRRTEPSASDSSDEGTFLISNIKFRVGAPPPQPLPVTSGTSVACKLVRDTLGTSLESQATRIALAEGVEPLSVELVARFVPGSTSDDSDGNATILIVARWNESSPPIWEKIVRGCKKFADASTRSEDLQVTVNVEMVAEELTLSKYISPVPSNELTDGLARDWPVITAKALDILDAYPATESRVTSISLFKLGFSRDFDKNPLTVYISVDYESEESKWPPVVGEIQQLLHRYPHNLHLHLEHNTSSEFYPEFPLIEVAAEGEEKERKIDLGYDPYRKYKKLVDLGDDIGAGRYLKLSHSTSASKDSDTLRNPLIGTLGCWIEIKTIKEPQWTKYALTNYHVVRPAFDGFQLGTDKNDKAHIIPPIKNSELWAVDLKGMGPSFNSNKADMEHPTRTKHCFAVQVITQDIEDKDPDTPNLREHLNGILSFFDNGEQQLGSIYCASGYTRRTAHNGRLDWALIKPIGKGVHRIGKNALPGRDDWVKKGYVTSRPKAMGNLKQPPALGLRSLKNAAPVFKLGTTTGPTAGLFSQLKGKVKIREDAHVETYMESKDRPYLSDEFQYLGFPNPAEHWVAKRGDSGAAVFDGNGAAVGLLFRGHMANEAQSSYAYITPIEDVFADIKAFSKQQITDIRIAEDH